MAILQVLLIEDTVGIPILKILEKWGYHVTLAQDGEQAWSLLNEQRFDMFLIDWVLPGMSGLDLTKKIRQLERYQRTPILMISGRSEKSDVITAIGSGIDNYIAKPFTALQLRDKIADAWQQHQKKETGKQRIASIVAEHKAFRVNDVSPIVLLGEPVNSEQDLAVLDRRSLATYLSVINATIKSINADLPDLKLGYRIAISTKEIIEQLKNVHLAKRVVAVLVSPQCYGSPLLMARLMRERLQSNIPVLICCDVGDRVAESELGKYQAEIIDKALIGTAEWKKILFNRAIEPWIHRNPKTVLHDSDEKLIQRLLDSL
ncbi:MAG: two-component system chemotaxis response regulator CheY [Candidatus Latescibacterota bacterium]|jgi:two-component system chemotaxis response regulator CheY